MHRVITIGLAVWAIAAALVGGLLLAPHVLALPVPPTTDLVLHDALAQRVPRHPGRWSAVHLLYRGCACSRRTIQHLLADARPPELDELVVIVDDDARPGAEDDRLRAAGFAVEVIAAATLRVRFHVEAVPTLVVIRPDHALAYIGGYNRHKQSAAYEDVAIITGLRAREARVPLPVFGCPTSARLAAAIDPLGLEGWR